MFKVLGEDLLKIIIQIAPANSAQMTQKIFGWIPQSVELWIVFNTGSQWSVSRGNDRIK